MSEQKPPKLLGKRLWVEILPRDNKTDGGLIIPDTAAQVVDKALVFLVGSEVENVKEGDTILIPSGSGSPRNFNKKDYYLIDDYLVEAVL